MNLLIWAPVYISVPAAAHVYSEMSTRGRPRFKVNAATLPPLFKILPLSAGFLSLRKRQLVAHAVQKPPASSSTIQDLSACRRAVKTHHRTCTGTVTRLECGRREVRLFIFSWRNVVHICLPLLPLARCASRYSLTAQLDRKFGGIHCEPITSNASGEYCRKKEL